jgi:hypothetical protein
MNYMDFIAMHFWFRFRWFGYGWGSPASSPGNRWLISPNMIALVAGYIRKNILSPNMIEVVTKRFRSDFFGTIVRDPQVTG